VTETQTYTKLKYILRSPQLSDAAGKELFYPNL